MLNIFYFTSRVFHRLLKQQIRTIMTVDVIEVCKKNAAYQAVEDHINFEGVIGVGSGSTIRYVIERLASRCSEKNISLRCVPTSNTTKQLLEQFELPVSNLDVDPVIDVAIDGADEIDRNFVAIKGGGGCATQEKIVSSVAKKFVIVADYRKDSYNLGDNWKRGIPIDVIPNGANVVRHKISQMFQVALDQTVIRMDPSTNKPFLTDDGNYIIDWLFDYQNRSMELVDWTCLSKRVKLITGVVEIGLFDKVDAAYFGQVDGKVIKKFNADYDK